jgi:peptide/nickel transport system substrate-binding protein
MVMPERGTGGPTRRALLRGVVGAAALGSAPALAGCGGHAGGAAPPAGPKRRGGVLRVATGGGGSQDALDPFRLGSGADFARLVNLFEPVGTRDLDFVPQNILAEEISSDATAQNWTIRLRKGVEFHNGKTLTADDLIFSIQKLLDPKNPGFGAGQLPWLDARGLRKLDDRTVRFPLSQPVSVFRDSISSYLIMVVPVGYDRAKPVGTGPFKFKSLTPGDRSVMERFGNYWNTPAWVDELQIIDVNDPNAAINALLSGQVDAVIGVPAGQAGVVRGGGAHLLVGKSVVWMPFELRSDVPPFNDVRARQAMRLLVDREQMVRQVLSGYGAVGNDLYSPFDPVYAASLPQRHQDLDQAKSLLRQAGLSDLSIELPSAPLGTGIPEMCQVLAEQAKGAGVKIAIRSVDGDTFNTQYYAKAKIEPQLYYNQAYLFETGLQQVPTGTFNSAHWNDPEFTRLNDAALRETDATKRRAIALEMQRIQYERGSYIIWGHADAVDAYSAKLGGFVDNKRDLLPMNNFGFHRAYFG